jgi:hypothetical protein
VTQPSGWGLLATGVTHLTGSLERTTTENASVSGVAGAAIKNMLVCKCHLDLSYYIFCNKLRILYSEKTFLYGIGTNALL